MTRCDQVLCIDEATKWYQNQSSTNSLPACIECTATEEGESVETHLHRLTGAQHLLPNRGAHCDNCMERNCNCDHHPNPTEESTLQEGKETKRKSEGHDLTSERASSGINNSTRWATAASLYGILLVLICFHMTAHNPVTEIGPQEETYSWQTTITTALGLLTTLCICQLYQAMQQENKDIDDDEEDEEEGCNDSDCSDLHCLMNKSQKKRARRSKLSRWHCRRQQISKLTKRTDQEAKDKKQEIVTEEQTEHNLNAPPCNWRPRQLRGRAAISRWSGGCRRKMYRAQSEVWAGNHKADIRSNGTLTSIMIMVVSMLQNSESAAELTALVAAALTVVITLSMMMCGTASSLLSLDCSALNKWRVNIKALRHMIPTTSLCWYNLTPTIASINPAIGVIITCSICYLVLGAWCSVIAASTTVHTARASTAAWNSHWTGIYQNSRLRAKYTAAYVYLDTKVPDGVARRKYLLDLGAAASVIPLSSFSQVCLSLKLAPSESKLRSANGGGMKVAGEGELEFLLPGTSKGLKHNLQVTADGAMPEGLRILGIDFWHNLKSNVDMPSRTVTGTTPDGENFKLNFHVSRGAEDIRVNSITATQHETAELKTISGRHQMVLADTIEVQPGQVLQVRMVLPDSLAVEIQASKWSWWGAPEKTILWEPSEYQVVTDDDADYRSKNRGAVSITPTGASILDTEWKDGESTIRQFVFLPPEAKEPVFFSAGTCLGTVQPVELTLMNDPIIQSIIKRGTEDRARWMKEAKANGVKANELLQEINSIMSQEAERGNEGKQTTIRHKPEAALPSHDIRGAKSGSELIKIWESAILNSATVRQQYEQWTKEGPGSGIEYGPKLTRVELRELQVLCFVFKDIFSINPKAPPEIKGIEHALYFKTNNPKPHRRPLPKLSLKELQHMDTELTCMLSNHIIEHSDSEWATLPVFAKKKDGTLRTAIDYRGLNAQILGDNFSVPNIGEVLESLIEAKRFSCYDCSSGFWGLKLREEDRHYTAFHGYYKGAWNLFQWRRMPFGLKAATATYQRMQQRIMGPQCKPGQCKNSKTGQICEGCDECKGLLNRIVKVFVDDGCVYSNETKDHANDLARVFCRLAANQVSLKPVKCLFGADQILLLGHEVTASMGVRPDPSKVSAVLDMEIPQTVDGLHNFVGATGWVSKFIPEYAELVKPLRNIIHSYDKKSKASIKHEWEKPVSGAIALRAFETIRLALASRPCLAFPDSRKPFIIITDASKVAIGAVLCQLDEEGQLQPVAYGSTPLKAGANGKGGDLALGISAKEGHALCWAVNRWRHLIYGTTCICLTDHSALQALVNPLKEFDTERMARMALTLSEHDLIIAHRPGASKELMIADMLSRAKSANNPAKLASLTEQAWGCIGRLCTDTKLHLSKEVMSEASQQRRLQHQVDGAELREMVKNREVKTVQEMVRLIETGERELRTKQCAAETLPNRFDEMYEMITTIQLSQPEGKPVTDDDVLAAQAVDLYCKQMKTILSSSQLRVSSEALYQQCKWQAPYHIVTDDGLLRRLLWKPGSKAMQQVQEGRAPAVVPDVAVSLQIRLCKQLHSETGHSSYLKTHGLLAERYIWPNMSAQITQVAKTCNQCDYFGDKNPKAPITGHVTAAEPADRVMMDIIHMKECEGYKYVLTLVDIFSRWGVAIPLQNIKASSVVKALRRHAIPAGMGRPNEFLIDGGSEFKGEMQEACRAWGSQWRPHTPYHSESAGAIERFNKTLELRVAHFAKEGACTWVDALPLATEAYNGSMHAGLSANNMYFSPAELWLGRKIRFNSDVRPTLHQRPSASQEYGEWLRKHTQAVKDWIADADETYRQTLRSSTHTKLRVLKVGDSVSLRVQDLDSRDKNAGADTWDGPWEVTEVGDPDANDHSVTDYLLQRLGSRQQPKWQHIDNLKQTFKSSLDQQLIEPVDEEAVMKEATKSSPNYEVEEIVGERGKTRKTKHYLVKYAGYEDSWWQPVKNLYCTAKVQAWDALDAQQKIIKTAGASVANPEDINLIMDLSVGKQKTMSTLIRDVCSKLNIDRSRLRGVVGSPMCNTFTKLDHVNRVLGHHFREPYKPYPPRKSDGTLESLIKRQIAQEHDAMTENLINSVMQDRAEGYDYDFCFENPRGLLRCRPYMMSDKWMQCSSRCTTDYCPFDHDFQKSTDLWHSFGEEFQTKGCTGDGRCHRKCGKGRYLASGSWKHWKRHAGEAGSGVTGTDQMLQKWMIPHKLCEEIVNEMKVREGKDVIIDLFSGGESYRAAVENAGCIYVPVDIKTIYGDDTEELQHLLNAAEHRQITTQYERALARKDTPQAKPDDELILSHALAEMRITAGRLQKAEESSLTEATTQQTQKHDERHAKEQRNHGCNSAKSKQAIGIENLTKSKQDSGTVQPTEGNLLPRDNSRKKPLRKEGVATMKKLP